MSKSLYLLCVLSLWITGTVSAGIRKRASLSWIVPGAVWNDTNGHKIDAHGGQVWQENGQFYFLGSAYSSNYQPRMYTSPDLINWSDQGIQYSIGGMFRPKLFKGTSKYFIYGQVGRNAQQLYSSTILKGWARGKSYTLPPNNYQYTDEGAFMDDDGSSYILTSADHNTIQINALSGDGIIGSQLSNFTASVESPGLFKANGTYYLIVSSKTGYRANPNTVYHSTSLAGPWIGPADIAPEAEKTYGSQNTYELVIKGTNITTYIFLGDAWSTGGTPASNYMWLPMTVDPATNNVTLNYHAMWKIDVTTGLVSTPSTGKRYEAEHADLSGRGAVADCEHCISKRALSNIDPSSQVTFKDVHGTGDFQWVSFHYTTNNKEAGEAHIYINDDSTPRNISDYNIRAGSHKTVPIRISLKEGPVNTIRFGCTGSKDFKIHLDGIEVHED